MKNYLVKSLYRVKNQHWGVHDRSHENNLYENYQTMQDVSVASFKKHLQGDWELVSFEGEVDNITEAFEKTFWNVHELWHREPCNILYTDPDTVAIKPVDPWGFNGFRMFNFTDPKSLQKSDSFGLTFPYYFNAGVRYFGHDMHSQVWTTAEELAKQWNHDVYDSEQVILNQMLWMQGFRLDQALRPAFAYQLINPEMWPLWLHDVWNGISINSVGIIHVHGSRDAESRLAIMRQLFNE